MFQQKLVIIVINYGTPNYVRELLSNFLASLPRFPKLRIDWVVANAEDKPEADGNEWQEAMRKEFKNKKGNYFNFLRIPNRGFAYNVNLSFNLFLQRQNSGYELGESDLILTLNPDTSLYWVNLEKAIDFMKQTPQAAVAGLALTNPKGKLEKWGHSTTFPSLKLFFGRKRFSEPTVADIPTSVAWVSGGAMLVRFPWWRKLGGLEDNFFFYFEDVDFCHRVKNEGGEIFFLPQATVNHRRGGSEISIYKRKKHYYAAEARYFHLYRPPTEYLLLRFIRFPFKIFYFCRCYFFPSFWTRSIKQARESLSSEKKEGFPLFYSFMKAFVNVPFLKGIWLTTILFNLLVLGEAIWGRLYLSSPLILHYNAYMGIDLYGDIRSLFAFPILTFLISIFNLVLSAILFISKRYAPFTIIPVGISLVFQMIISIALLNLLIVNNL